MSDTPDGTGISRREALGGLVGVAGLSGLSGCLSNALPTGAPPDQGSDGTGTLRFGQVLPPVSLDPVEVDDPWSTQVVRRLFQSLYAYDRSLNLVPVLAEGQPRVSDDGRTYTVTLRDAPRFHDGSDLSAADVKYSLEAPAREGTANRWKVDMIEEITTPDDTTVEFTLRYPYPNFGHSLTQPIVPRTVREENAETFGHEYAVGTGPYRFHTFKQGQYAFIERWDDYWGPELPTVNWLKFASVHSGLARSTSLRTGQNAIVERVQPHFRAATDEFPHASVVRTPSYTSYVLGFNTSGTPLSSRRVREAVDYLVSVDEFVEEVVGEAGRRQYGPIPPQVADAWELPREKWQGIPHNQNTERGRLLLQRAFAEMDVSQWSPTVVAPHNDYLARKLANTVVQALRSAGFRRARAVTSHWHDFRETITSGNQHDYALFVTPYAGGPDPDSVLYPMVHENMQGVTGGTYYNEESVMRALAGARRTRVREERKRRYGRAITTLLEDRALIPAFVLHNSFGVKQRVSGFEPHPLAGYNPMTLTFDGAPSLHQ